MKSLPVILTVAILSSVAPASAATITVKFDNPDKYSDIDYYNGSSKKFKERLFKSLKEHINEEANKILPENYQLNINFTNIDLAGRYEYTGNDHIRIVRDIDFPRLKFSFKLSKDGNPIKVADVYLKDMNFLRHNQRAIRSSLNSFYHETRLLDQWLLKEIKPLIN